MACPFTIIPLYLINYAAGPQLFPSIRLARSYPGRIMLRRGGKTPNEAQFPPHYHLHAPCVEGLSMDYVEQIDVSPVPEGAICQVGQELPNLYSAAWREALRDALTSRAFRRERILNINWLGSEGIRRVGTEMLRGLFDRWEAEMGTPYPIEQVPVGAFLSPEQIARVIGGFPNGWVLDPYIWDWHYKAWELLPGVSFTPNGGHIDRNGRLLIWSDGESAIWRVHGRSPYMARAMRAPDGMVLWVLVLTHRLPHLSFTGFNGSVVNAETVRQATGRSDFKGIHQAGAGHEVGAYCQDPVAYAQRLESGSWLNARSNTDPDVVPYFWNGESWGLPHGVFMPRVEN